VGAVKYKIILTIRAITSGRTSTVSSTCLPTTMKLRTTRTSAST
jgi:hypothetical protein